MARAAVSQAKNLQRTDASTAAAAGSNAAGNYAAVNPFLTNELRSPEGYSQQDLTSQLSAAEGGAGGATAGLTGAAALMAARTRNSSGFGSALDAAARSRQQALAGSSEGIAANNADLKQKQQQAAASGLSAMYGTNLNAQQGDLSNQDKAIGTEVTAGQSGWLQNALAIANTAAKVGSAAFPGGLAAMGGASVPGGASAPGMSLDQYNNTPWK
jgi:hypothetical protein